MSAITGIFMRNGKEVDPQLMKKMNDKLSHRGPDGSAIWCDGPVGLGHQMLWTTPESLHEVLPLEEDGLVITADARIDNRAELSEELGIRDEEDVADSYFILKAYANWGEDCPDKLLGDFAFVIWDKKEEKLFCARDHMGVKPFYYYLDDDMFVFGTEIKALFCVDGVPREINELKVAFHLMRTPFDKLYTFYENIFCLTSANSLIIDQNGVKITPYWILNPNSEILFNNEEKYFEVFREIFTEAVNCRLRSAFHIGFELSGGLDSSTVVSVAKNILSKKKYPINNIKTFSMIFNDFPQVDESYYVKKIVEKGGIKANFIIGDKVRPLEQIGNILWHQDQPFDTHNMTLHWRNFKKMEKNKIRILLDGNGGDEVVSHGQRYIQELGATMQWLKFIREIKGYSIRTNQNIFNQFLNQFIFPLIPTNVKNLLSKNRGATYKYNILNKDFEKKLGGENHLREIAQISHINIDMLNTARKFHYSMINNVSHQSTFETQDRISSAFSIEVRHPFLDKRLIEFCYAIPNEMKFRSGWDRYILRVAMKNILPKEIQWRPLKNSFSPVLDRNLLLLEKKKLKKYLFENEEIGKYVDLDTINHIYQEYISGNGNPPGYYSGHLWIVIILSLWLHDNLHLNEEK